MLGGIQSALQLRFHCFLALTEAQFWTRFRPKLACFLFVNYSVCYLLFMINYTSSDDCLLIAYGRACVLHGYSVSMPMAMLIALPLGLANVMGIGAR